MAPVLRSAVTIASLFLTLGGCEGDETTVLLVDLQTDIRPGEEFDAVRVSVGDRVELRPVTSADDFGSPTRLVDLDGLAAGRVTLDTELLLGGAEVVSNQTVVELTGTTGVVVVITRSCIGVSCPDVAVPTTCLGGGCVPSDCSIQNRAACGTPACADDSECSATLACAPGRCGLGVCLFPPDDSLCGAGQVCGSSGCTGMGDASMPDGSIDAMVPDSGRTDSGVVDSSVSDAPPGVETCNGADDDSDGVVDEGADGDLPTACRAFGATAVAGGWQGMDEHAFRFSRWSNPRGQTVVALWAYLWPTGGEVQDMRSAIYTVDTAGCSEATCGTLVASSEIVTPDPTSGTQWVRFALPSGVGLGPSDYYLGVHNGDPNRVWSYNTISGSPGWFFGTDFGSGSPPTFAASGGTTGSIVMIAERSP
jgi:hypothetical protein